MVSSSLILVLRLYSGASPFYQVSTWIEDMDDLTLSHIIRQEVIKKRPSLQYSDMYITPIISKSGTDVLAVIASKVSVLLQVTFSDKHNEVGFIINK